MAIKINGKDLAKRIINGQEVQKVMLNGSQIRPTEIPPTPVSLCFSANTSGSTVTLNVVNLYMTVFVELETSIDGETWNPYTIWDTITLTNAWDKVYFRNTSETSTRFSWDNRDYYTFSMTWSISASWDITSLLCKNGTTTLRTIHSNCFRRLFQNCTSLTSAPKLPLTTLASACYLGMFSWCTSLTAAPALPATEVKSNCYSYMFSWCTSLTTASALPATTIGDYCYTEMFSWCTSLTTLPALPATTLAGTCYNSMFKDCSVIKLSETQTWEYQTPYRIPSSWTWVEALLSIDWMFTWTWWTFTWTPTINTTYYTSNTIIS